jgi:hypothetical protein
LQAIGPPMLGLCWDRGRLARLKQRFTHGAVEPDHFQQLGI